MKHHVRALTGSLLLAAFSLPAIAGDEVTSFEGEGSGRSAIFATSGPWMLDWSISSDFPVIAKFEMRLHDGGTGALIGPVIDVEGTGQGSKLFAETGEFQLTVVATGVQWQVRVTEADPEMAARVVRESEGRPTLADRSAMTSRRVGEGTFDSWRPENDSSLLLFDDDGTGFRVSFDSPCAGLAAATALSFVTARGATAEEFDSVILEDGTRCYFGRVIPSVMR